jgi:hypothetical protein
MLQIMYFVESVKCPSLLTDRNYKYAICGASAVSDMFTVSKRSCK